MLGPFKKQITQILNFIEKTFKVDSRYLVKNSSYILIGHLITTILNILVAFLLINQLTISSYGEYTLILTILSFFSIFSLPGMQTALVETIGKNRDGFYFYAIKKTFLFSCIGSILLLIIGAFFFLQGQTVVGSVLLLMTLLLPVQNTLGTFDPLLRGKKRFDLLVPMNLLIALFRAIIIIMILYIYPSVFWVLILSTVSLITLRAIYTSRTIKLVKNKTIDKGSYRFGLHLSVMQFLNTIQLNYDKILVSVILGIEELAILQVALLIPDQIKAFSSKFSRIVLPKMSSQTSSPKLKASILHKYTYSIIFSLLIILCYILFAPYFFNFFFNQYPSSTLYYSQLFSLTLLAIPSTLLQSYFEATQNISQLKHLTTITFAFRITVSTILVLAFGLLGAIIARVSSKLFSILLLNILFRKPTQK